MKDLEICSGFDFKGKVVAIEANSDGAPGYVLTCEGIAIATSQRTARLADYAFGAGAREVRHDYDMTA